MQMRKSPWLRLRIKEMQQTGPSRPVPLRVWRNGAKVAQTGSSPPQTGGLIMRGNKERRLSSAEGARWQQERREEAGTHRGVRSYLYVGDQTSLHQRHVINTPHKNTSETHCWNIQKITILCARAAATCWHHNNLKPHYWNVLSKQTLHSGPDSWDICAADLHRTTCCTVWCSCMYSACLCVLTACQQLCRKSASIRLSAGETWG